MKLTKFMWWQQAPVAALSYQQLRDWHQVRMDRSPIKLVFHLHVPKAGGNSIRAWFGDAGFIARDFDMNTSSFFSPNFTRKQWLSEYQRAPQLMTGHFRLDCRLLRDCPVEHTVVTLLRDPLDRILSHYNHALRTPGSPWREQLILGDMSFLQYAETFLMSNGVGPQYSFFDDSGDGTFAWTGKADVQRCLYNLFTKTGTFGIFDGHRLSTFVKTTRELLNQPLATTLPAENITSEVGDPSPIPLKEKLTDAERAKLTDVFRDDVHFYSMARAEWDRRHSI